jgi:hypothetical protein
MTDEERERLRDAYAWKDAYVAAYTRLTEIFQPTDEERAEVDVAIDVLLQTMPSEWTHDLIAPWRRALDLGTGDLDSALGNNATGITTSPRKILLELTGAHDEKDWHWIVELDDGRFAYIHGGCDYTGWDCRSDCDVHEANTFDACLRLVGEVEKAVWAAEFTRALHGERAQSAAIQRRLAESAAESADRAVDALRLRVDVEFRLAHKDDLDDCYMAWADFVDACRAGGFTDDDGHGELATDDRHVSNIRIYPNEAIRGDNYSRPDWATHVIWYNK